MVTKRNIAIVVGHTTLRKGACGINMPCEFDYMSEVARNLCDIADIYHYDSYNLGYRSMVKRNATKLNRQDYDLVLELHYNAATPIANGCEVFYYFSNKEGKKLAGFLSRLISKQFQVKDRGAKPMMRIKGQPAPRGFWALYYPKATTLLLEPFFGSNGYDAAKFRGKEKQYANLIRTFLTQINYI